MIELLARLLVAHFVCDYPLQGDFLAKAKNGAQPIPGVPWQWAMLAHCSIQAGGVWFATGSWIVALLEFVAHWVIDCAKCNGLLTFGQDQFAHVGCKVLWAVVVVVPL